MKLDLSVFTEDQVTVLGPLVVQPLLFEGWVTWRAAAEEARARRLARANMVCPESVTEAFAKGGRKRVK